MKMKACSIFAFITWEKAGTQFRWGELPKSKLNFIIANITWSCGWAKNTTQKVKLINRVICATSNIHLNNARLTAMVIVQLWGLLRTWMISCLIRTFGAQFWRCVTLVCLIYFIVNQISVLCERYGNISLGVFDLTFSLTFVNMRLSFLLGVKYKQQLFNETKWWQINFQWWRHTKLHCKLTISIQRMVGVSVLTIGFSSQMFGVSHQWRIWVCDGWRERDFHELLKREWNHASR